jgi:dynein heavy chain 2
MKETLKKLLVDCLSDIQKSNSGADPLKYPSQILCLAENVTFTERCERAIHSNSLENLLTSLKVMFCSITYVNEIIS